VRGAACPPRAQRGEGDHPKGGGGVIGSEHPVFSGNASALYPSTSLRLVPLPISDGEDI
jgi:hypothetical protein